jgi:hypothetical protein
MTRERALALAAQHSGLKNVCNVLLFSQSQACRGLRSQTENQISAPRALLASHRLSSLAKVGCISLCILNNPDDCIAWLDEFFVAVAAAGAKWTRHRISLHAGANEKIAVVQIGTAERGQNITLRSQIGSCSRSGSSRGIDDLSFVHSRRITFPTVGKIDDLIVVVRDGGNEAQNGKLESVFRSFRTSQIQLQTVDQYKNEEDINENEWKNHK